MQFSYVPSTSLILRALDVERSRYHDLLTSILPKDVAEQQKRGETVADHFDDVSVLFVDLCDFTALRSGYPPSQVVDWLNHVFSEFDALVAQYGLEKIKLARHSLMVAERLPWPRGEPTRVRIGVHVGPLIAGVIGASRFLYDL
jgi:adenylate cyclase